MHTLVCNILRLNYCIHTCSRSFISDIQLQNGLTITVITIYTDEQCEAREMTFKITGNIPRIEYRLRLSIDQRNRPYKSFRWPKLLTRQTIRNNHPTTNPFCWRFLSANCVNKLEVDLLTQRKELIKSLSNRKHLVICCLLRLCPKWKIVIRKPKKYFRIHLLLYISFYQFAFTCYA